MDPRTNPYAPGAGTPPPELAGRDELVESASIALDRIRGGRSARSLVMYGLRGVGKTVLLNKMRLDAEATGVFCVPIEATQCYPYFLQEWGQHSWRLAEQSPITLEDAYAATEAAIAQLDTSFFRVRFDRLTPSEKRYMRAMAELGPGPHRSGDVAEILDRKVSSLAPTRSSLIKKGMAYSPAHGDIAFTVPLFDGFMKRIMNLETT